FTVLSEYAPEYPEQEEGIAYGLDPDSLEHGYLKVASPGRANGQTAAGFVGDTTFNVDRGFFDAPFDLEITTSTEGATIRYTTNGSTPTATRGTIYNGPIRITGTTVLRAAAFKADYFETNVDTHTYLFLDDVRTQYSNGSAPPGWPSGNVNGQQFNYGMDPDITSQYSAQQMIDALSAIPSVSLVTDQSNLTASDGIYTNPGSRGKFWERPASFEILDGGGIKDSVQSNCGLRIRGGFSRSTSNPKHAFRLFFRNEYGAGKLNYPLFEGEGVDRFDKFDLRTSQNYSWSFQGDSNNTFLREVLGRDLQGAMGQPYTKSRYYHLYLNGVYWGLFMTQERAEATFGEAYLGGDADDYDTVKSAGNAGGYNTEATDGTMTIGSDWHTLWTMTRNQRNTPTIERFMEMQGLNPNGSRNSELPVYLDVDNLIDYTLIIGYTGNYDAPLSDFLGGASNNWFATRNRERDDLGFQFFIHDGEHSLGAGGRWGGANDRINTSNGANQRNEYWRSNPGFMHFDLEESTEEYRMRFADRAHLALFNNGILTRDTVLSFLENRQQVVAQAIIAESARWGDSKLRWWQSNPFGENDWRNAVNQIINTINTRRDVLLGQLRIANLYPDLAAPAYSQHGGTVPKDSNISLYAPSEATRVYYMIGTGDSNSEDWQDDLDPRLLGGDPNPEAGVLATGGGPGGVTTTEYISRGDTWKYLDDGSDQGTAWRAANFDDSGWAAGPSELGYGDNDEATIVNSGPVNGRFATTYFSKTVDIEDPTAFGIFELAITYDDAYAIYVNGNEIARHSGLSANASYNEFSSNVVGNNAIDTLNIPTSRFAAGSNRIAVEIHQNAASSSDISFNMKLTGRPAGDGNNIIMTIPEAITSPVWVKSRSYNAASGEWSALNQAFFTTAPAASAENIVISQVHYHPRRPGAEELLVDDGFDQDDFEFVEVMNISDGAVDLGGSAFVLIASGDHLEGIEFEFPLGTLINPGQRLVVAANSTAFAARYPEVSLAGDYKNRLDNNGEWITLVDSEGEVIDSFRYNDAAPWPEQADGDGPSL
ncbi:MAG: CotH kinase family protein, partial [Verrucomicrobiales bacterium]|nr:CotH kinase family protein [Verrucomicrobiales bacterium]